MSTAAGAAAACRFLLDQVWKRLVLDETLHELLEQRSFQVGIERLLFALVGWACCWCG